MNRLIARDILLTPRQAAAELGIDVRTVRTWLDDGRLPFERLPLDRKKTRRIRRSALQHAAATRGTS